MQVVSIDGDNIVAEVDGVRRSASLMILGDEVKIGDFLIIHAGFAISKLDEDEARETIRMMKEVFSEEDMH
jgi:hydrogenase expression/formation protein HypC